MKIEGFRLKRPDEIEKMRAAGKVLGACLAHLAAATRPGLRAIDLDREAETFIRDHRCVPGFIGYNGFPNSLCVSINEQVVHGIPGERVIEEGDLVSLDCGLILDGWWAELGPLDLRRSRRARGGPAARGDRGGAAPRGRGGPAGRLHR